MKFRTTTVSAVSGGMTRLSGLAEEDRHQVLSDLTRPNKDFDPGIDPPENAWVRWYRTSGDDVLVPRYYDVSRFRPAWTRPEVESPVFVHRVQFGPRPHQKQAVAELERIPGDVGIQAPCAWGKTWSALNEIARLNARGLVIVHNEVKMAEWREAAQKFLGLAPELVGHVQASKRLWERHPITIAMLKTMAVQEFPREFEYGFGTVVVDECHLSPTAMLSLALGRVAGRRIALSATPGQGQRRDLLNLHFGPRWIQPKMEQMHVRYEFVPIDMPPKFRDMDWDQTRMHVGWDKRYAELGGRLAAQMVSQGRRVLVLAHVINLLSRAYYTVGEIGGFVVGAGSIPHLTEMFPSIRRRVDAIQEKTMAARLRRYVDQVKADANPIFGTGLTSTQPAGTGMDVGSIDGAVIMLPTAGSTMTTQIRGRLERACEGKMDPLVVVMVPHNKAGLGAARAMEAHLKQVNVEAIWHAPVAF